VVARESIAAGAEIINDIWAFADPDIARVAADSRASLMLIIPAKRSNKC
jgi:dihydropteroate synthase